MRDYRKGETMDVAEVKEAIELWNKWKGYVWSAIPSRDWEKIARGLDAARRWVRMVSEFPTGEQVEAGAKAMYEADDAYDLPWSDQSERNGVRDWYRDKVRVALVAAVGVEKDSL